MTWMIISLLKEYLTKIILNKQKSAAITATLSFTQKITEQKLIVLFHFSTKWSSFKNLIDVALENL